MEQFRGTTILSVRRGNSVVIGGDGQVSLGNTVMKGNARKVRRLYNGKVIAGFAGVFKICHWSNFGPIFRTLFERCVITFWKSIFDHFGIQTPSQNRTRFKILFC